MKRIAIGVGVLMLALGVAAALHRAPAQPSTPSPLTAQALPAEAFPQSYRLEEGPLSPQALNHPLNSENLASMGIKEEPLRFREGYGVGLAVYDGQQTGLVFHFLYRYADPAQARRAAEALIRAWGLKERPEVGGWEVSGRDSEGGALRTLVQVRGEVLSLLIVNGTQEAATRQLLDQAVQALAARWER
jgi:hypothetical protein